MMSMKFVHIVTVIVFVIVAASSLAHLVGSLLFVHKIGEETVIYFIILVISSSSIYVIYDRFLRKRS